MMAWLMRFAAAWLLTTAVLLLHSTVLAQLPPGLMNGMGGGGGGGGTLAARAQCTHTHTTPSTKLSHTQRALLLLLLHFLVLLLTHRRIGLILARAVRNPYHINTYDATADTSVIASDLKYEHRIWITTHAHKAAQRMLMSLEHGRDKGLKHCSGAAAVN
jgi:hypothetical protein